MFGRYLPAGPDNQNYPNGKLYEKQTMIIEYVALKRNACRCYYLSSDCAIYPRPEGQKACIFFVGLY